MKRPWQVWSIFAVLVLGAAAAMVWLTRQAVESDAARRAAEAETELEQRVSLALWRMDTALAPILAEEVIRPPAAYRTAELPPQSTPNLPAQQQAQASVQMPAQQQAQVPEQQPAQQTALPQSGPPPEVAPPPEFVVLNFEVGPDGHWRSPQVPAWQSRVSPEASELAGLSRNIEVSQLTAILPSTPLPTAADVGRNIAAMKSAPQTQVYNPYQYLADNTKNLTPNINAPADPGEEGDDDLFDPGGGGQESAPSGKITKGGKAADFGLRSQRIQSVAEQTFYNQQRVNNFANAEPTNGGAETMGVSRPLWVGDQLLLARRVVVDNETRVQGSVLDWPQLKKRLLTETAGLLPHADLVPVPDNVEADPGRMLAGLPVRLVVGPVVSSDVMSPTLRWALWMGWGALAVATAAAAALLGGVMALSERRAAFVSSVTHELRTPLTTFRMYAEMLARGMVPDAERRQEYLHTLQREAERLTLLVENVLAYARLERGRRPQAIERVRVGELLARIGPRLCERAAQANMQCEMQFDDQADQTEITTDLNVVEQILFNLVDNAAKYAAGAADGRIHVVAHRTGRWMQLGVCDHGPGIQAGRWSRRMRAFRKSAEESAESAPGVGLGLALCRRLAGELCGRLEVSSTPGGGATVTLCLPA